MVPDDLGNECKSEATAGRLGCDERIEEMLDKFARNAGAVVTDAELERQTNRAGRTRGLEPDPGAESGRKLDFAIDCLFSDRLGTVFHEIEKNLNQLVAIGEDRWQRRIVVFVKANVASEARLRDALHVIDYGMDVDALALDRPLVGKSFHPIDELHDAIGLIADETGPFAVGIGDGAVEQLCRAADAG